MATLDLRDEWRDLLSRRPALAGSLGLYTRIVEVWAAARPTIAPLAATTAECRRQWMDGVPLVVTNPPSLAPAALEEGLGVAMESLAECRDDLAVPLQSLAEAWDSGDVRPAALLPVSGQIGTLHASLGLGEDVAAWLAIVATRPWLQTYFADCRAHLRDGDWDLGVCPFCGAPPGFGDIAEDGRRRLACHLCGATWTFRRLRCPFCGNGETKDLGRLEFESPADQGYFVSTCRHCQGYVKELDRRVRWNGGPALVEDWGSPHVDLAAAARGLGRPLAPVILRNRAVA